mmetsp:Transcript_107116/g.282485  ORF Transcript_107116/g.282485 Transcript_107116/m.282485 type:complete len:84 (-) Transcript_107116:286-537(-)
MLWQKSFDISCLLSTRERMAKPVVKRSSGTTLRWTGQRARGSVVTARASCTAMDTKPVARMRGQLERPELEGARRRGRRKDEG